MSMRKYKNVWYKIGRIQRNKKIEINVNNVLTYICIRGTMYLGVKGTGSQANIDFQPDQVGRKQET